MKKFLLTLLLCLVMSAATASAVTPTRISDYTVDEFFNAYNNVAVNVSKNNIKMSYPNKDDDLARSESNSDFTAYISVCDVINNNQHIGSILVLYANKEGHVSKISQIFQQSNATSRQVATAVTYDLFRTLKLTESEIHTISETIYHHRENKTFLFKCHSINRSILIHFEYDSETDLMRIDYFASSD